MRFSFVNNIYQTLLIANSRVSWEPEELVPVGMILRDLKNVNMRMLSIIEARKNELNEEGNKKEEKLDDVDEESVSTA